MGVSRSVRTGAAVEWAAVRHRLASVGEAVSLKMIDGMPAFPDEEPEPDWRELRVGFAAGMVTLRREAGAVSAVVWGNADAELLRARDRLCEAVAAATGGVVVGDQDIG